MIIIQEETQEDQGTLEKFYLVAGFGALWSPPGSRRDEGPSFPAEMAEVEQLKKMNRSSNRSEVYVCDKVGCKHKWYPLKC